MKQRPIVDAYLEYHPVVFPQYSYKRFHWQFHMHRYVFACVVLNSFTWPLESLAWCFSSCYFAFTERRKKRGKKRRVASCEILATGTGTQLLALMRRLTLCKCGPLSRFLHFLSFSACSREFHEFRATLTLQLFGCHVVTRGALFFLLQSICTKESNEPTQFFLSHFCVHINQFFTLLTNVRRI